MEIQALGYLGVGTSRLGRPPAGRRRPCLASPLQVIDGNYQRMPGRCPWWDTVVQGTDLA